MPIMTKPLAHIEMLISDLKFKRETLCMEAKLMLSKSDEISACISKLESALDEERKKLQSPV